MSIKIVLAALTLSFSAGQALAEGQGNANQAMPPAAVSSAVGHWLYGPNGRVVGSVRSLADDGQTAVIMVGSYFQPGSHEMRVSSSRLSITDGKATLRPEMAEALNSAAQR